MTRITEPIDGLTLINRAVAFGNMSDVADTAATCRRLRVLPPGAPYVINQRGEVFAVARRKKDYSKTVANAHAAMQKVLADVVRGAAPRTRKLEVGALMKDGKVSREELRKLLDHIKQLLPSRRWFRIQGYEGRRIVEDDTLIVPTLDGLVAASAPVLWAYRNHIRQCHSPACRRHWIRETGRAVTCGRPACEEWRIGDKKRRIREKNKKASRKSRAKAKKARHPRGGAK